MEVAKLEMFRPRSVVVPVDDISRALMVDVAMFVADEVEIKNEEPIDRNFHMSSVLEPCRASCDCDVDAMINLAWFEEKAVSDDSVVVPIPSDPVK